MPFPCHPCRGLRIAGLAVVVALFSGHRAVPAQTVTASDTIVLIRKFSGLRFATSGSEVKVFGGMFRLSSEFESVLGKHPQALQEARRARPYSILQLVGVTGVAVAGALAFKQSLDQADDPLGTESSSTPLVVMASSGAVALTGLFGARHHLKQSVRLFNDRQRSFGAADDARGIRLGVGLTRAGHQTHASAAILIPFP